jgi:hypothetical protein
MKKLLSILAFVFAATLSQFAVAQNSLVDKVITLTAPVGGVVRQSTVSTTTDTITVVMMNTSPGVVPAGSRITRGAVWKQGWRR